MSACGSTRERVRRILALALPIIGGMASQNLLNLIDTVMVGRLGSAALGAVGLGSMVNWLASAFFMALGSGVQALASRRTGQSDARGAVDPLHAALVLALAVVLPCSLLLAGHATWIFARLSRDPAVQALGADYLAIRLAGAVFLVANFAFRGYWNGIGRSTVYLRTILLIHAVNIALNGLLIYGTLGFPRLGVRGAAYASVIGAAVGTGSYLLRAWRFARPHGFLHDVWGSARRAGRSVLRLSVPTGVQNTFLSAGFVLFYRFAGQLGTRELAISNVLIQLAMVCLLPSVGFGLAAATMVGISLGAGQRQQAACWVRTAVGVAMVAMVVPATALVLAPRLWLGMLLNDPAAAACGVVPLVLLAAMQPFDAVGSVLSQALLGAGAVRVVMLLSVLLQWGLFLPGAYGWAIAAGHGLTGLWLAFVLWRLFYALAMAALFRHGRWAEIAI
ncbi:MAG: MATE family efflux transporter [Proteobacteria bacterium]|nr:MATE family efflux transporter [Pseudomonadota bacterium]